MSDLENYEGVMAQPVALKHEVDAYYMKQLGYAQKSVRKIINNMLNEHGLKPTSSHMFSKKEMNVIRENL